MRIGKRLLAAVAAGVIFAVSVPWTVSAVEAGGSGTYGDLTYFVLEDGTVEITDCDETAVEVEIPAAIDGMTVTSIGWSAFDSCSDLTVITIPDTVSSIEHSAFRDCASLIDIVIPDGVTCIESSTFSGCTNLTSISIPDSVTTIEYWAFEDCSALKYIYIPKNVTDISDEQSGPDTVFEGCTSLQEIVVDEENPRYFSYDGVLYTHGKIYSDVAVDYRYPVIGYDDTSSLLVCPQGKTTVSFPENIELNMIDECAFQNCKLLTNIDLPVVQYIEAEAFIGCDNLVEFHIPEGTGEVNSGAFSDCINLKTLYVPNSLSFGYDCTPNCPNLTDIYYDGTQEEWNDLGGIDYCDSFRFTTVHFSDGTTRQPEDFIQYSENEDGTLTAFAANKSIMGKVTIPSQVDGKIVTVIGDFCRCSYLEEVVLPNTIIHIGNSYEYDLSGSYGFGGCKSLTRIDIPENTTSIGDYAFDECTSLTDINIPNNVRSIGDYAFSGCSSLITIDLPENLEHLGTAVFNSCTALQRIVIPDNITSLPGDEVDADVWRGFFAGCTALEEVTLPANLEEIDEAAFADCTSLQKIVIPEGTKTIGFAFAECTALTDVTIPESVESISNSAFRGTPWLENKQKENPMVIVNGILFDGSACKGDVVVPDTVRVISPWAFSQGYVEKEDQITSVIVSEGVEVLGGAAFASCRGLKSVVLPSTVHEITIGYHQITKTGLIYCSASDNTISDVKVTIKDPTCVIYDDACTLANGYDWETEEYATDTVICGYAGSTAQAYAEKYGYPFEEISETDTTATESTTTQLTTNTTSASSATSISANPDILYGDTNLDGRVDITDAVLLNKAAAGAVTLNDRASANADCNGNSELGNDDALILLKFLVHLVNTLPYTE